MDFGTTYSSKVPVQNRQGHHGDEEDEEEEVTVPAETNSNHFGGFWN